MDIGAHVDQTDPIAEAKARKAPHVQLFLGDPQSYKGPVFRYAGGAEGLKADAEGAGGGPSVPHRGGAEGLKADAEAAGVVLYVHAPYLINVAATNNRPRIPGRKLLQ